MNKLKIEHGISRVKRVKLQTYIHQSIADDLALIAEYTNNEQHYIINELLRFALAQSEEFQQYRNQVKDDPGRKAKAPTPILSSPKTFLRSGVPGSKQASDESSSHYTTETERI